MVEGTNTGGTTRKQDDSAQQVHMLDLLIVLVRRRKAIVSFSLIATALALVTVVLLPNQYTAITVVMPPQGQGTSGTALLSQLGGAGGLAAAAGAGLGIKTPGDMYVSLFHSRTVEDAMVKRFDLLTRYHVKLQTAARGKLEAKTKIDLGVKDGLITVSVIDKDPNEAASLANGYVDELRRLSANLSITEASQRRAFFQQQLLEANENLVAAEEAMKTTEQATGVLQIDSQTRALIETASALRAEVAAKEVQIQGMRTFATDDNPALLEANQQFAALRAQLAKVVGAQEDSNSGLIAPKGNLPEAQVKYLRKLRDVKYYETISELIAKQFEAAKLDEARQGTAIQVVDVAIPPERKSGPKRGIIVLGILMLSLLGACAYCLVAAGLRHLSANQNDRQRLDVLRAELGMGSDRAKQHT